MSIDLAPVPLPSDAVWARFLELLTEYRKARGALIEGEGLVGEFVFPCFTALLDEAQRHFRRARSEVFEAILITRLDTLREILDSLRRDPQFRIAKATHYDALQQAFDRGRVSL